jgi:hypothetical protein
MKIFIDMFNPLDKGDFSHLLLQIFDNMARNNQVLSKELLGKLEKAVQVKGLEQAVLPIIIQLIQTGHVLSQEVKSTLLDLLLIEEACLEPVLRQELLSSLGALIKTNQNEIHVYKSKISDILIRQLSSNNQNIVKSCVSAAVEFIRALGQIDEEILDKLVQVCTNLETSNLIKLDIEMLFEHLPQDFKGISEKKQKVFLANLNSKTSQDILYQLKGFVNVNGGLLPKNYSQLKEILDNEGPVLQEETLDLLHMCNPKCGMTDDLLESVAVVYESTRSEKLRQSCLDLCARVPLE